MHEYWASSSASPRGLQYHVPAGCGRVENFTHTCIDLCCLLADPHGFKDPPLGIPVAARTRCWMDIIARMVSFP
jgi:hypothetical protein